MTDNINKVFKLDIESNGSAKILVDPTKSIGENERPTSSVSIDDGSVSVTLNIPLTEAIKNAIPDIRQGRYTIAFVFESPELEDTTEDCTESSGQQVAALSLGVKKKKLGFGCYPDGGGGHFCIP